MQYVSFGSTDMKVSRVSFGALPIQRCSYADAEKVILEALDQGINFFDTARSYTDSESKLGRALQNRSRTDYFLASKSGSWDGEQTWKDLHVSLKELNTDYLDLWQLHGVSTESDYEAIIAPGGALEVMRRAQQEGWVRHLGVTTHSTWGGLQTLGLDEFVSIMVPFNFMETEFAEEVIPLANEKNVAVVDMKPFGGGMIENASLAMRYILTYPGITITIPGMATPEEVRENVSFIGAESSLTPAEQLEMEDFKKEIGSVYCRGCDYCAPCPEGVSISKVLRSERVYRRLGAGWVMENLESTRAQVERCIACGVCLPRCPYHLQIPDLLRETLTRFEGYAKAAR